MPLPIGCGRTGWGKKLVYTTEIYKRVGKYLNTLGVDCYPSPPLDRARPAADKQMDAHDVQIKLEPGTLDRWAQVTFRLPNRLALGTQKLDFTITQPALFMPMQAQECKTVEYLFDPARQRAILPPLHQQRNFGLSISRCSSTIFNVKSLFFTLVGKPQRVFF